jgi:predicted RNase H-like HicB family nuclease
MLAVMKVRYVIVVERSETNYAAYVPDLLGCVATGKTIEATERLLREAIAIHIAGLREDGLPVPEPGPVVDHLEIFAEPMPSGKGKQHGEGGARN